MIKIDFDIINEAALANLETLLARLLPDGKRESGEYVALNPTRTDSHPGSFKINLRSCIWSDFATGESGGDPVSLVAYLQAVSMKEAAEYISGELAIVPQKARNRAGNKHNTDTWIPIMPVPDYAPEPPEESSWRKTKCYSTRWAYRDSDGRVLFYTCRFDKENGDKEVLPICWCRSEKKGIEEWRWKNAVPLRPLYGLDQLAASPELPVILMEGEKCADAGQLALPEYVIMAWPGGCKAVGKSDFSPLAGRKVILWPDKDEPGLKAMIKVHEAIKECAAEVFFLHPPDDAPKGWDIADAVAEGWDTERLTAYLQSNLHEADEFIRFANGSSAALAPVRDRLEDAPFRCLGYNDGVYFYLPAATQQVEDISPLHHTSKSFLSLAPLNWWYREYGDDNGRISWQVAMDNLMRKCERAGIFDDRMRRGCGAWFDDKRVVLHLGDHLLVDDVSTPIHKFTTRYVYEAAPPAEMSSAKPLTKKQAHLLMEANECLAWEKPVMGKLLAGWCVLAPVSGALQWRPHVWLTGSSGTGKSWVVNNIVKPILGSMSVYVQSNTTEAGIRQALGVNAFPVVFDEAEGEDVTAQYRLQKVIELLRQASSEGGGQIYKGSQGGKAVVYQIRSCFLLSSIGVNIHQRADASRISILSLGRHHYNYRVEFFEELENIVGHFSREWCAGLRARSIRMIPVIRENARSFSRAAADHFGDQRIGDQVGTLLAGAFTLTSDGLISAEDAAAWIARQDWQSQETVEMQTDEVRCLNKILQTQLTVNQDGRHMVRSVACLLARAAGVRGADDVPEDVEGYYEQIAERDAVLTLARYGLRYSGRTREVVISSYHNGFDTILKDTPWVRNYARILKRIEGATEKSTFRFETGVITRAVGLPHDLIFCEYADSG